MIRIELVPPAPGEVCALRALTGWGAVEEDAMRAALDASVVVVLARDERGGLVGIVRAVGDGVLYAYVQDLIVHPDHRGDGIARVLMARLMEELHTRLAPGASIGLMAVAGLEAFYAEFGFAARPAGRYGAGMTLFTEPAERLAAHPS
ncbi:GNAT family N-acetyltransferase [Pontivivens ytuae]|uniref:GNAT family N-acetyltransferase n=1 Tax=Pontivivens ytuae TaxID=2789856 RepID=A0A7S9LSG8_9RHOB|nr:GNAT family N-acetyltransferase [Pontivivens ytuae]QPH54482.1 GNAT family N-acetyltransferase [Pontivivens ytuae]